MRFLIYVCIFSCIFACAKMPISTQRNTALVALGKALFQEQRLSANGTKSCASCHSSSFAFTDGYRRSAGIEADETLRNAPSLYNVSYYKSLTWANPNITTFEQQMLQPLFKKHAPELGLDSSDVSQIAFLQTDTFYQNLIKKAFPKKNQTTGYQCIIKSIAAYEKTLIDFDSPYDAYKKGNLEAISSVAKRGEQLFFSQRLQCQKCHPFPLFTDANQSNAFHQIMPSSERDLGLFSVSGKPEDKGKFRTPSLRNVTRTAPYMHDGSIEKLEDALLHFDLKEEKKVTLSDSERKDLLSFLESLSIK
jgi:cytochrome c peroxidase